MDVNAGAVDDLADTPSGRSVRGARLQECSFLFRCDGTDFVPVPEAGLYQLRVRIPRHLLGEVEYSVTASLTTLRPEQLREYRLVAYHALSFMAYRLQDGLGVATGKRVKTGMLAPRFDWSLEERRVERN